MAGVFLSYSRADHALAEQVIRGLRRVGVEVWWDQDMPGVDWQEELERELNSMAAVVVLWTANSIGSKYVRDEARLGLHREKLVNVLYGVPSPPFPFDRINGLALDGWNGREPHHSWSRLVETIEALAVKAGNAQPGEIIAELTRAEQDLRDKQRALAEAQQAFQDAQALEAEAGETEKATSVAQARAEADLGRIAQLGVAPPILRTAQQELDATHAAKDEAIRAHRAAKAQMSEASRRLSRAGEEVDDLLQQSVTPPLKPGRTPREPPATRTGAPPSSPSAAIAVQSLPGTPTSEPSVIATRTASGALLGVVGAASAEPPETASLAAQSTDGRRAPQADVDSARDAALRASRASKESVSAVATAAGVLTQTKRTSGGTLSPTVLSGAAGEDDPNSRRGPSPPDAVRDHQPPPTPPAAPAPPVRPLSQILSPRPNARAAANRRRQLWTASLATVAVWLAIAIGWLFVRWLSAPYGVVIENAMGSSSPQQSGLMVVSGDIRNVTNHDVFPPPLRIRLETAQGYQVAEQVASVSGGAVPAGQTRDFTISIGYPPDNSGNAPAFFIDFASPGAAPTAVTNAATTATSTPPGT